MFASVGINLFSNSVHRFNDQFFNLRYDVAIDRNTTVGVCVVDYLLETLVRELIAILECSIVLGVLLHGIVSQVHVLIIDILQVDLELTRTGSQIAFLEDVQIMFLI
jgi:hypothetical protein